MRLTIAVVTLGALLIGPGPTPGLASDARGDSPSHDRSLEWRACGENPDGRPIECSSLEVPRNHARPAGARIRIGITRMQPASPDGRFLFINGGGPGINGLTWLQHYSQHLPDAVSDRMSVIGMDPRGLPTGTLFPCYSSDRFAAFIEALQTPPRRLQEQSAFDTLRGLTPACRQRRPRLTAHMGSEATARDMDLVRRALGARRLDYLGISYGTRLGSTYADLFPRHVRHMILDSVTPANRSWWQLVGAQAAGFETSLGRWAQDCDARATCPFPDRTKSQVLARLQRGLRAMPHSARVDRIGGLAAALFNGDPYREMDRIVSAPLIPPAPLPHLTYGRSQIAVTSTKWATVCADGPAPRTSLPRFRSQVDARRDRYPVFGARYSWLAAVCQGFPGREQVITGDPDLRLMLLNGRDDPATPLSGVRGLRNLFPASFLTVWKGRGHSVTEHDGCRRQIAAFLLRGHQPGRTCR